VVTCRWKTASCRSASRRCVSSRISAWTSRPSAPYPPEKIWQTWLVYRHFLTGNSRLGLYTNPSTRAQLKSEAIWEIEGSLDLKASDLYAASTDRSAWYQALQRTFTQFDYIAVPTAQVFPFDVTQHWPKQIADRQMDTYHRWMEVVVAWTLSGCPVISVPVGFNADGLPMGCN
jgi:amidase